ncbi:hypothetical protein HMPREF0758_3298 [Serratia odorifera DSM 4582]|uniref:Uncharacterized protein n=1 Tax=Serratia odorifera DSM 4582 TaxID=667129 RepID=D4E548_SEROD|nr:hypothetical protein HMPREF0758_3298 [Serratia odorifera DSM 4582]
MLISPVKLSSVRQIFNWSAQLSRYRLAKLSRSLAAAQPKED